MEAVDGPDDTTYWRDFDTVVGLDTLTPPPTLGCSVTDDDELLAAKKPCAPAPVSPRTMTSLFSPESVSAPLYPSLMDMWLGPRVPCPAALCLKTYAFKGDMVLHLKRQHPEEYTTLENKVYKRQSTREGKAYGCPVAMCECGYRFMRDLRRHVKLKHPEILMRRHGSVYEWE